MLSTKVTAPNIILHFCNQCWPVWVFEFVECRQKMDGDTGLCDSVLLPYSARIIIIIALDKQCLRKKKQNTYIRTVKLPTFSCTDIVTYLT